MSAIQAASMLSMVYSLTKDIDISAEIIQLSSIIEDLKKIYEQDIDIFNAYLLTLKLPKNTDEEKNIRYEKLQELLKEACNIPVNLSQNCIEILKIANHTASIGNPHALSDVEVGVELSQVAAISALAAIDMNIRTIKDLKF